MKHTTGLYPRLHVDTSGSAAVGQAGGVLLVETIRIAGIDRGLSAALGPWRKPLAVHDPGKVVLDLAVALALGGDCLADVDAVRAEPAVFGLVASDPTVSRLVDTLAGDVDHALAAIETARAAARAEVWSLAGEHAPDHASDGASPLIVDLDATLVASHSEKEHAAPTFKRGYGSTRCARSSTTAGTAPGNRCTTSCGPGMPGRTLPPTTSQLPGKRWRNSPDLDPEPGRVARS